MRYKAGTARIAQIETDNDTFRITTREDPEPLAASIRTAGLINPPVLLPESENTFTIICGFRRINACRHLGWEQLAARFLPPDSTRAQCVLVAIADNCSARELNLIETARALKLLSGSLPDDKAVVRMAREAGLPMATAILPKIRSLESLPALLQQGLIDGTLSLAMAQRLQGMPVEDALEAFGLFCEIRAGLNVQREILDNAGEAARREGIRLLEVLRNDALMQIRTFTEGDRSWKTRQIRKWLKTRRYPALSAAEERFAQQAGKLDLPQDMRLVPPAGFEGADYSLSLRFNSLDRLHAQKDVIERLLRGHVLKEILD
jgi:hypothetical protein